ncbi:MAG: serine/threonine protein kinase [Candidatus Melainabacteria bacterium]|jgi:tRNA A-37 threonylcarbamoyl transferase component Bud32|nr:serine/threonine protein kinase [Candidatus Melainabacteria bacterium]
MEPVAPDSKIPVARKSRTAAVGSWQESTEPDSCEIEYTHQTEVGIFSVIMNTLESLTDTSAFDVRFALIFGFAFLGCFILHPVQTVFVSTGLFALLGLTLLASGLFNNYPIITNSKGITWSPLHALSLRFRFTRPWSDIRSVEFTRNRLVSNTPDCVCIVYKDGCDVQLRLAGFTKKNLEMLLLMIRNKSPQAKWLPSMDNVKFLPSMQISGSGNLSFTGLWLDEIGTRLGSTAFVPLDPGTLMQDGRIRVLGQIALGGLSAIYLAQTEDKKTCVLKESVVPFSCEDDARNAALDLFKREAQLLAGINHPRIAKIYDFFVEDAHHYLLMEYLEGSNLRQYVKEHGPQKEAIVILWAKQIADILTYLHSKEPPIIHRDLTPDNLIVEDDGAISLIDFGAANQFLSTATGTIIGKTSYMSLEQFRGKSSPSCDIFSLGCTLQFLLLGVDPEPFSYSTTATGKSEWKNVQELIRECKNQDPRLRPTAQMIADRLQVILQERLAR